MKTFHNCSDCHSGEFPTYVSLHTDMRSVEGFYELIAIVSRLTKMSKI